MRHANGVTMDMVPYILKFNSLVEWYFRVLEVIKLVDMEKFQNASGNRGSSLAVDVLAVQNFINSYLKLDISRTPYIHAYPRLT